MKGALVEVEKSRSQDLNVFAGVFQRKQEVPDPEGPLSAFISPYAISLANRELQQELNKDKDPYKKRPLHEVSTYKKDIFGNKTMLKVTYVYVCT